MLQSFINQCGCCGCNGIYDALLQQHLRWSRWVLPILPPCCLLSDQNKPEWQGPSLSRLLQTSTLRHIPPLSSPPPLNPPFILLMSELHRCPHIVHQVWICVNDPHGRTSWFYWCLSDTDICISGIMCEIGVNDPHGQTSWYREDGAHVENGYRQV